MSFRYAFVLPTTHCEERCVHCFYESGHTPRVAAADYVEPLGPALDGLMRLGLQQVIFTGGEALSSPLLPALVEQAAQRLLHILLITRGSRLTEPTLQALEEQGVDDLTISVTPGDAGVSETVRRVLFRSRYIPTLLACLTRAAAPHVPAVVALGEQLNLPLLFTPAYIPRGYAHYEALSLRRLGPRGWERLAADLQGWAEGEGGARYWEMVRDFYEGPGRLRPDSCAMGTLGLVIDADGAVYPCFHRHDLCAGNLRVDPWPEIEGRLLRAGPELARAPCFGEHCLSMFI